MDPLKETREQTQQLLDTFAAAALTGIVGGREPNSEVDIRESARVAYDFASAMLDERDKRNESGSRR